jgi:hypothetical protein
MAISRLLAACREAPAPAIELVVGALDPLRRVWPRAGDTAISCLARTLAIEREPDGAPAPGAGMLRVAFTWTPVAVVDLAGGTGVRPVVAVVPVVAALPVSRVCATVVTVVIARRSPVGAVALEDIIATCSLPVAAAPAFLQPASTWTPRHSAVVATVVVARGSPAAAVVQSVSTWTPKHSAVVATVVIVPGSLPVAVADIIATCSLPVAVAPAVVESAATWTPGLSAVVAPAARTGCDAAVDGATFADAKTSPCADPSGRRTTS